MINTYKDISNLIEELNNNYVENTQVQKIFSSSYYISIQLRIPGLTKYLYLGRGHGHEGLYLSDKQIPSVLRKKDRLLEYLRKHIASCMITSYEMDSKGRGFCINFQKWKKVNRIFFFYQNRDLYFQSLIWNESKQCYSAFKSWSGSVDSSELSFDDFNEIGRSELDQKNIESSKKTISKILKEELDKINIKLGGNKTKKFLNRKLKNIESDLARIEAFPRVLDKIDAIDFESLPKKVSIEGISFKFKTDGQFQRRNEAFHRIKKLKKAKSILLLRQKDTQDSLEQRSTEVSKDQNDLKIIEPVWRIQKSENIKLKKNEYIVIKEDGLHLAYGLSANGNEQLRSEFASKEDWWFHLSDRPSTHVIVKGSSIVTNEVFERVGRLFCSLESASEVDIVFTQNKYVKSSKGKAGLVTYKKERYQRYKLP